MNVRDIASRILRGEVRAASKLMRAIEDHDPAATAELQTLFPHTGKAWVIGITGPPGAGKSTLTDRLIAHVRATGRTVGVLAVDPTSPFTGGAILGDRIRMQTHATDPGVFVRSMATRGQLGGLSRATGDCIRVMEALGRDVVLVETVGVGQDEIDISRLAHTTVLVLVPGMGDDIQAIKAGILEVADLYVVNKADLDGADRVVRELTHMLELRHATLQPAQQHDANHVMTGGAGEHLPSDTWTPPILKAIAARDSGVGDVLAAVWKHAEHLDATGERFAREQLRARTQFVALLKDEMYEAGVRRLEKLLGGLDDVVQQIARRVADP